MNSKKNTLVDRSDDLTFIPLNIKEPFKSKDSSWVPCMDVDANNMTNNFFIGLPDLQTTQDFNPLPNMNTNPVPLYPATIPTPSIYSSDNNTTNNNSTPTNIADKDELYPSELPALPQLPESELYNYTEDTNIDRFTNALTHLDILRDFDLSINSDITNDTRCCSSDDIDKIFNDMEKNNNGVLSTLKSYKIPYPIATLIIKKIIKLTLDYSREE
ncbi:hypothetical protein [Clostridium gasigenes]|uniref:Uncharacterized protein n=1 Tax=Clostridium gasigenes TaxID=94869 RepID=A0A1H0UR25_9CLOT|nr:hypothetical protein [Clostridium gasigenes]MBB6624425.1 hypothetical protein [Clostridium gasigenes]MBU3088680.1 hypothetical protein [Clostridium gasigenes]MBU3136040.1 hypothetical protein [Clostridium gasigenes]SDP68699.1 hypothetical protein SAMN04488529_11242 [Clostridium gasigenes]